MTGDFFVIVLRNSLPCRFNLNNLPRNLPVIAYRKSLELKMNFCQFIQAGAPSEVPLANRILFYPLFHLEFPLLFERELPRPYCRNYF